MTTIIPDFGLAAHLDRQTPPPSPAVTTAQEISAQAQRLAQVPITSEDRRALLAALAEAGQHLAEVAVAISLQIQGEAPPLSTLGEQPWARTLMAVDAAGEGFVRARDAFEAAVEADEDIERCEYGGDYTADLRAHSDRLDQLEAVLDGLTPASELSIRVRVYADLIAVAEAITTRAAGLRDEQPVEAACAAMGHAGQAASPETGLLAPLHVFAKRIRAALDATTSAAIAQQRGGDL
ncbi:hypothetical protein [Streptosporangium saharense]|uniref:hypothetical protein n=1 Tax=Streptosporangium saharense TaxID=1706840 RepID=UPI00341AFD31